MAFKKEIQDSIIKYVNQHLSDQYWFKNNFYYIFDTWLSKKLAEDFKPI